MNLPGAKAIAVCLALFAFWPKQTGIPPRVQSRVTGEEFIRALASHRASLVDFYFHEHLDPNARGVRGCPLLLAATLQQEWTTVRRLIGAGASVDLADENGFTPLMAAAALGKIDVMRDFIARVYSLDTIDRSGRCALTYAIASRNIEAVNLLLSVIPVLGSHADELLAAAIARGDTAILTTIADRLPQMQDWTNGTRQALATAVSIGDTSLIRLLLKKHS